MAIKRFGQKPRGRGFPDTAGAGKQVSMVQPLVLNCITQGASDGLLAGHFVKALRPPFACDYLIGHEEISEPEF